MLKIKREKKKAVTYLRDITWLLMLNYEFIWEVEDKELVFIKLDVVLPMVIGNFSEKK